MAHKKEKPFLKETVVGHLGLDCEAVEDPAGPKNVKALKQNNPFLTNGLWAI